MSNDETTAAKKKFALALLRNTNAFIAASSVFEGSANVGKALEASTQWPGDPVVIEEMERLLAERGDADFLPSRAATARQVYVIATETAKTIEDRLKAFRLYSEIQGFISKTGEGKGGDGGGTMPQIICEPYDDLKDELAAEVKARANASG